MKWPVWIAALLGAVLALSGCAIVDETPSYRYKLTVEVDTPEGTATGASVIEVDVSDGISAANPAGSQMMYKVRGEAVAIDLPKGRTIFALLRSQGENGWAHTAENKQHKTSPHKPRAHCKHHRTLAQRPRHREER